MINLMLKLQTIKKNLKLFLCSLLFLFTLSLLNANFANASDIAATESSSQSATIENVHLSNIVDRLVERITMLFKFSTTDKINYQMQLTEKRLGELDYAVVNDRGDLIEELSSRYSTYVGNLTEMIVKNKALDKKQSVLDMYNRHSKIVDELDKKFEANSGLWLLMEHDKNYLKIYSDQLKDLH